MPPKHFDDCVFCDGRRYARHNGWKCIDCNALWTLGGRLIHDGQHSEYEMVLEHEEIRPTTQKVVTEYLYYPEGFSGPISECRLRIFRHNHLQVILVDDTLHSGNALRHMHHFLNLLNREYGINRRSIIFVQNDDEYTEVKVHWYQHSPTDEDEVDAIDFTMRTVEQVENAIGVSLLDEDVEVDTEVWAI